MIGIIDYGMANLRSVQKAFERLGVDARILAAPEQLLQADRLVLPGVGAFADGIANLDRLGFIPAIYDYLKLDRPFLGICLGLQMLFDSSEEDAPNRGLGVFPGKVRQFIGAAYGPGKLKVPHMGWNDLHWSRHDPLLKGLQPGCAVYFVHSYYAEPQNPELVSAKCEYGSSFCASLWKGNIWATQFHPEKSQKVGLTILANFASV